MDKIDLELLARIATQYYEKGQTQQQIAETFGYSRSMISRFLAEAQRLGVVEIRIHFPLERCTDLEEEFRSKLGLKEVNILARGSLSHEEMLRRVGGLGARLVENLVTEGMVLGISWGTSVWQVTNALQPHNYSGVKVVQMIGALGESNSQIDGPDLARNLARIFGGTYFTLAAPLIVDTELTRDALINDSRLQRVLQMTDKMDMTLMGIGTVDPRQSSLVRAGYLTHEGTHALAQMSAVGDVCAIHFDRHGNILDIPLHHCRVGVSAEQLRGIPIKVGVGGGEAKGLSILGACRSGLVNYLVTDETAALKAIQAIEGDDGE